MLILSVLYSLYSGEIVQVMFQENSSFTGNVIQAINKLINVNLLLLNTAGWVFLSLTGLGTS